MYKYYEKRIWGRVLVPAKRRLRPYKKDILDAFVVNTDTITLDDLNAMGFHRKLEFTLKLCAIRTKTIIEKVDNYTWAITPDKLV